MKRIIIFALIIIVHFSLKIEDCKSQTGWFSQPLPVSGQVQDLKFFDVNTGLITMFNPTVILRTTNGGYNWYTALPNQICFEFDIIDSNVVFGRAGTSNAYGMLLRSFNRGATWDSVPVANSWTVNGISFVNRDTGWVGGTSGGLPYLWRTTNAGLNWTVQSDNTGFGKVFFLKTKVNGEYVGWSIDQSSLWKTTNSGQNWNQIYNIGNISKILFTDKNTGYASNGDNIKKTSNGGFNWNTYYMPTSLNIYNNFINHFKILNNDTIYGTGGNRDFGLFVRGIIWVSTNGGINWNFEQPDTSIHIGTYNGIDFVNKDTGWSSGIRTNDGGGPIICPTYIDSNSAEIPKDYVLKQNYPNPFNPSTTIEFSIPKDSYVTIKIIDMTGRTVFVAAYEFLLYAGIHKFKIEWFEKLKLSSGIYFYRMEAKDKSKGNLVFTETRKMVYIK
ncbi:MAG: T9SS type A sorting domain-containing protein [Ignavibacteria bacterium]